MKSEITFKNGVKFYPYRLMLLLLIISFVCGIMYFCKNDDINKINIWNLV